MSGRRVSITFSDYLGGGMLDGVPLWRDGVANDAPARADKVEREPARAEPSPGEASGDGTTRRAPRARSAS